MFGLLRKVLEWLDARRSILVVRECTISHACCVEGPCNGLPRPPEVERYPHCDPRVLHRPGSCEYCAMPEFAALHAYHDAHRINCTGERDPKKRPCPAELARPLDRINRWPGNRAKP